MFKYAAELSAQLTGEAEYQTDFACFDTLAEACRSLKQLRNTNFGGACWHVRLSVTDLVTGELVWSLQSSPMDAN